MRINNLKKAIYQKTGDFKKQLPSLLKYQLFTKILLFIAILPMFTLIVNTLFKKSGLDLLVNSQIISFGFSKVGLITVFIIYITAILIVLIELGGLIVINNNLSARKSTCDYYSILKFVISKTPKFFGIGGALSVLFIFIFISIIGDINIFRFIGIPVAIPPFIKIYIDESTLFTIIYSLFIISILFLSVRWVFSLHFILLDGQNGLKALNSSSKLIKRNRKAFYFYTFVAFITLVVSLLILISGFNGLIYLIKSIISQNSATGIIILIFSILLSQIGGILLSFIVVPLLIFFITDLYYLLLKEEPKEVKINAKSNLNILDKFFNNKLNKRITIISIIVLTITIITLTYTGFKNIYYNITITAHKGNTNLAIENTLEAIEIAIKQGADFAEIDIQESKDGQLFLFHDNNLKRITGINESVTNLNYEEISKIDISNYGNGSLLGTTIPLLEDAIRLAKEKNIKLNIEIKTTSNNEDVANKIVALLQKHRFINECVISSFNYDVLQEIKTLNNRIKVGYHMYLVKGDLSQLNVDFISLEQTIATKKLIDEAHFLGKEVHVWTINTKDSIKKFVNLGVDNITTDEVDIAIETLNKLKENPIPQLKFK